ncbi:MAG: hypothetical protein H6735_33890 [Alphaproteobacteria bacterium]|nr:hypothetical protein [Alphaproteobacteria bacterium]
MQRFVRPEPIDGSTRVQRVFDTQHVAHRACRTVTPGEAAFDEIRDRLRRMAKVVHPHLAKIVAVGEESGELKVVTEWLPGGSIADHPDPGRLLVGVADALYALHREGLAHGHVHPRSLVFDGEGVIKLVDGGVCDGSVIEDLESFGAALKGLYAGRPMPAALATVAVQASAGAFGDAQELKLALEEALAMVPPPSDRSLEPDVHVVDTAPPVRDREIAENDEEPETRWLLLLLLAGLLAVLLVLVAAVVGWFVGTGGPPPAAPEPVRVQEVAPAPAPAPVPGLPAPAPAPVVVSPRPATPGVEPAAPPVEPDGPTTVEIHLPPPGATVVAVERVPTGAVINLPPPMPAPVAPPPVPAPTPPPPAPTSGWRVVTSPGKAHPTTTLVLDARSDVKDRLERAGRPRLEIRCKEHRLTVDLDPGVRSVEAVPSEVGVFSMTALVKAAHDGLAASDAKLRMVDGDTRLYFPTPERWVSTLGSGNAWTMSYTPFASPAVVAVFDTAGLDAVLPEIRKFCRL